MELRLEVIEVDDSAKVVLLVRLEERGRKERGQRVVGHHPGSAVGAALVADTVEQHALAVKAVERADPEIAVGADVADGGAALEHPFHHGPRGGHLPEGVVLEVEHLGHCGADGVVHTLPRLGAVDVECFAHPDGHPEVEVGDAGRDGGGRNRGGRGGHGGCSSRGVRPAIWVVRVGLVVWR